MSVDSQDIRIGSGSGHQAAERVVVRGDGRTSKSGYYLHTGPSVLPRQPRGEPMTLAEALYRAYGQQYAVVHRLGDDGKPVPVVADAGSPGELIHLPSGRRIRRAEITWHAELSEAELAGWQPGPGLVECRSGDDP